jgi:hypothetical protein
MDTDEKASLVKFIRILHPSVHLTDGTMRQLDRYVEGYLLMEQLFNYLVSNEILKVDQQHFFVSIVSDPVSLDYFCNHYKLATA